jgi:hypothetical protein
MLLDGATDAASRPGGRLAVGSHCLVVAFSSGSALFQTTGALPGFIFHSENAITYKTIRLTSGIIISSESAPANPAFEKIFQKGITKIGKTRIAISPATMRMIVVESIVPPILAIHFGVG